MQIKWPDAAALIAFAFVIGLFISQKEQIANDGGAVNEKEILHTRLDTAHSVIYVPLSPLTTSAKPNQIKTIVIHDTIFREACLDTLLTTDTSAIAPDTLSVCSADDIFSIALGLSPRKMKVSVPYVARDTFYSREDTVRVPSGEVRPWYQDALVIILSVAAGIVFGKL